MAIAGRMITSLLFVAMLSSSAVAAGSAIVKPDTPQGTQALARLQQAEVVDRMNYEAYLGSRENEVAMFYLAKRRHVLEAIKQLQSGEPVSTEEIDSALDTSDAWRYGSTF